MTDIPQNIFHIHSLHLQQWLLWLSRGFTPSVLYRHYLAWLWSAWQDMVSVDTVLNSDFSKIWKLTVSVVSTYWYGWGWSDTVNFLLFLGCWTAFVAVPYLTLSPIFFPRLAHHFVIPAVEVVTMIFWFAGFIAMGAQLPPPKYCHSHVCSSLQAATIFAAFEWWDSCHWFALNKSIQYTD